MTMQDFDEAHGHGWQCIVGPDFASFVTHSQGCFIHFSIGTLSFLLFKVAAGSEEDEKSEAVKT